MQRNTSAFNWLTGNTEDHIVVSKTDRRGKPLRTIIDMRTGLVRNDPIPTDEELSEFYANRYRLVYKTNARPRNRQILRNFRRSALFVERFGDMLTGRNRVLDCGSGSGEFLYLLSKLGKKCFGMEPNVEYAAHCRDELGLDVTTGALKSTLYKDEKYDFINLSHVLEHLNDPIRNLTMIGNWLCEHGVLYIEVPDIDRMCEYHHRGNMFHYGHIYNFNHWTLRATIGLAGLKECSETAQVCEGTTSIFMRRGLSMLQLPENRENAIAIKKRLDNHYAGIYHRGKIEKPFRKILQHAEETFSARRKSAREIGDQIFHQTS